jgi:hypothetical protein
LTPPQLFVFTATVALALVLLWPTGGDQMKRVMECIHLLRYSGDDYDSHFGARISIDVADGELHIMLCRECTAMVKGKMLQHMLNAALKGK